jgi:hypothetical protein
MPEYLPFISNENLLAKVKIVIDKANTANAKAEEKLYSNTIDPFSALFDASLQGIDLASWLKQEKSRQVQKTLQNAIGNFHQAIIGCVNGWQDLETGGVVDLKNSRRKIIAEIKNKHNTTKGNHKKEIYNDIKALLDTDDYRGFTGYYVEIIPKNKKRYNKPFTPPDNVTHTNLPANEHIRQIDGYSFYDLATGVPNALRKLFFALPDVISEITGNDCSGLIFPKKYTDREIDIDKIAKKSNSSKVEEDDYINLFDKAY